MEYIDLMPVVTGVIALVGALLTVFAVPYLKSVLSADKLERLSTWVRVFVQAAEQLFSGSGRGREKLEYVADMLRKKGYTIDVDDTTDAVRAMIEAAVLELNNG
jgi:LL-H family phage holin